MNKFRSTLFYGVLTLIVTSVIFSGCKRVDPPETVARKFANHFYAAEFEEAMNYSAPATIDFLERMQEISSVGLFQLDDEVIEYEDSDFDCTIIDENAQCTYDEYGLLTTITLVKIEGQWLVSLQPEEPMDFDWFEDYEEEDDSFPEDVDRR